MLLFLAADAVAAADSTRYPALHPSVQYVGRFKPVNDGQQVWAPGAYARIRFKGTYCMLELDDEQKWGKNYNYLQVIVDGRASRRIATKERHNRIVLASGLSDGEHEIIVVKETESLIGYIRFRSWICEQLLSPRALPSLKIEFIGNSITCGMGADTSEIPCGTGEWFDQHSAWNAYGPVLARSLNAQWHLSSESGIGLVHSCCDKPFVLPQVFDKMNFGDNEQNWDFQRYQPDLVSICLGQNDGIQDSVVFCQAYIQFVERLHAYYPSARFLFLSSPMADAPLRAQQIRYLGAISREIKKESDQKYGSYFSPLYECRLYLPPVRRAAPRHSPRTGSTCCPIIKTIKKPGCC